jgi:hypothetical protein
MANTIILFGAYAVSGGYTARKENQSLNNRYQPYRFNRCVGQTNGVSNRITPYSEMTLQELPNLALAMAYVPWQSWSETYDSQRALCRGTIFPQLDLPFGYGG